MTIEKIYLDMDGVLADFGKGLKDLTGKDLPSQETFDKKQDDALWEGVRNIDDFYNKLEPITGAVDMFNTLYNKYGNKIEILSAIPKPHRNIPQAAGSKRTWVRRLLSEEVVINLVYRDEKKNFAKGKGYILIDDFTKNIEEWQAAGGTGILFKNVEETLSLIKELENN